MEYPLFDLGGSGPLLNVAPANGIVPEAYVPMLRPLLADYHAVCLPPRALWGDQPVPAVRGTWETDYAHDLLDGLRAHALTSVVGIGHSFGGIATALAALQEPWRFRALVLLDPTILTNVVLDGLRSMQANGTIDQFPLAARARSRRRRFADLDEAYSYFRPRGIFADWDDETVRQYVEHGLLQEGDSLSLRWTPQWESYYFTTGYLGTWEMLPRLDGLLPLLIVRGEESDTYVTESAARVRELLPRATHVDVPGHGHMFPQSAPAETARIVSEWLAALGG